MTQATAERRLAGLKALGFNSEADYQKHLKVMEDSKRLAAEQKAASLAAGSTAFVPPKPKVMTYGDGNAIMILTGQSMGLEPTLTDYAEKHLRGEDLHPVTHAAMERSAVLVNEKIRHDSALIAQANTIAQRLKAAYGFSEAPTQ